MSQIWDDLLQEGSYDGVTFDFVSTRDEHTNDVDEQKFPGKDGAHIDPRGKGAKTIEVAAIFIEDDYPEKMNDLIAKLDNGGAVKKLVHPIFGEVNAACRRFSVSHDVDDARDSGMISISFIEDNSPVAGPTATKNSTPARKNQVQAIGADVLTALSTFQATLEVQNSEIGLAVTGAVNACSSIADSLEASVDDLSVREIQASANGALSLCDEASALLDDYDSTEKYELAAQLLLMSHSMRDMAQELIDERPPLSVFVVPADTNLLSLAHDMGVDAEELLALNSFADPTLVFAGTKVLAYVE